jgi:hypothetical protein
MLKHLDTLAVEAGGGVAFSLAEHLSLSPSLSGIYGHVENKFTPRHTNGDSLLSVGNGTLVNWTMVRTF